MKNSKHHIERYFSQRKDSIIDTLSSLIAINTSSPNDGDAFEYLLEYLHKNNFVATLEVIPETIRENPYYSNHPLSKAGSGQVNLRASIPNARVQKNILLQSHIDTVPVSKNFTNGLTPKLREGHLFGRGACDAKGNIVMAIEALRALHVLKLKTKYQIYLDIVVEEEIGGGGALGSILNGVNANEVIVLEPTELQVYAGHRGYISFDIEVYGQAVHMGSDVAGISAINKAIILIEHLKLLEDKLLEEASQDVHFNKWKKPLQLNIGRIEGGEWHGAVPEKCVISIGLGFLPKYSIPEIKNLVIEHVLTLKDTWILNHHTINFNGVKNDAYMMDPDHELPSRLDKISKKHTLTSSQTKPYGWKVSCDARLYSKILGLPTVIFGCGALADAHSNHEKVSIDELIQGAKILLDYLTES